MKTEYDGASYGSFHAAHPLMFIFVTVLSGTDHGMDIEGVSLLFFFCVGSVAPTGRRRELRTENV